MDAREMQELIFNLPEAQDWSIQYISDLSGWKFVKPWVFFTKEKVIEGCSFYRQFNDVRAVRISRYLASGEVEPTVFSLGKYFPKTED